MLYQRFYSRYRLLFPDRNRVCTESEKSWNLKVRILRPGIMLWSWDVDVLLLFWIHLFVENPFESVSLLCSKILLADFIADLSSTEKNWPFYLKVWYFSPGKPCVFLSWKVPKNRVAICVQTCVKGCYFRLIFSAWALSVWLSWAGWLLNGKTGKCQGVWLFSRNWTEANKLSAKNLVNTQLFITIFVFGATALCLMA